MGEDFDHEEEVDDFIDLEEPMWTSGGSLDSAGHACYDELYGKMSKPDFRRRYWKLPRGPNAPHLRALHPMAVPSVLSSGEPEEGIYRILRKSKE